MSKNLGKMLTGIGIGVGLGLLFAPDKGEKTRRKLKMKLNEMCSSLKDMDVEDVKESIMNQINDIKIEIEELDKEKVLKIAKEKGKKIVEKSEEIYKIAMKKGSKELQKAADSVRQTAIDVLNSTAQKLENTKK